MKQGNQFYLEVRSKDKDGNYLTPENVQKIQFNIGKLTKTYTRGSDKVTYNPERQSFLIWLTESETFDFENVVKFDVRVFFVDGTIMGSYIKEMYFYDSLKKVNLDV